MTQSPFIRVRHQFSLSKTTLGFRESPALDYANLTFFF